MQQTKGIKFQIGNLQNEKKKKKNQTSLTKGAYELRETQKVTKQKERN